MALFNVFHISGSAMGAQSVRLNTVASNLANADSVSGTAEEVYKSRQPVFASMLDKMTHGRATGGVRVKEVVEHEAPPIVRYEPNHPLADDKGNVYLPNINTVEEMANMISASRSYQNNIEVFNTSKQLLMRTLQMGN